MLLALMQPNDLKKVFTKMECTEFSKLYRTSKWVYNFLEDTTEDVMIFAHRYIDISPFENIVPNVGLYYFIASSAIVNTRDGRSPYGNRTHNLQLFSEAELSCGLDFPKCKAKFLVDSLAISSDDKGHLVEKVINCAISQGIKRVRKLEIRNRNVKLSRMMFEKLQPQYVCDFYTPYRTLAGFWNILSEMSAKEGRQIVIDSRNSVVELVRNCAKVQISSREPNSEIVPWIANQTKNFHKDNILKGLEMRVPLPGDPEIDRYFPNPTISFLPQESVFPVYYFVFSALKYSTFVEVCWIQSEEEEEEEEEGFWIQPEKGSLIEVRCWNCENSEEAANFLKESCKIEDDYFRGSWKQIIDDCFN